MKLVTFFCKIILYLMVLKLEFIESYKDPFDAYFARRCVESNIKVDYTRGLAL